MTDGVTNPTIETVLERINALGLSMGERMDSIGARVEKLESEVSQMRQDIKTGFRKVERAITLLNRDFLDIRGDNEELMRRVEELESKAS